jgi:hypothetical protein
MVQKFTNTKDNSIIINTSNYEVTKFPMTGGEPLNLSFQLMENTGLY